MTPKQKAKELFDKYYIICQEFTEEIQCSIQAKQCALIAVDEILDVTKRPKYNQNNWNEITEFRYDKFWEEVKHELEKL